MMKTLILSGGRGTRLGSLAERAPKPMMRIGGMPLIEHQIRLLKRHGLTDIILLTSHLASVIEAYFGDGRRWGVRLQYCNEPVPLGTAGGLKEIAPLLTSDFLLLYGDLLVDMNLRRLLDYHAERAGIGTLALHANDHMEDADLVETGPAGRICAFHAKPHDPRKFYRNLVNAAVYVLSPKILQYIVKGRPADFGHDIFPSVYRQEALYGYVMADYLMDIGTRERLATARSDYDGGRVARMNGQTPRRAVFFPSASLLADPHPGSASNLLPTLQPGAIPAIKMLNRTDYLLVALLCPPAGAPARADREPLVRRHKIMDTLLGRARAKIDLGYYCLPPACPPLPSSCENGIPDRLPSMPDAIQSAIAAFNIDASRSFLVMPGAGSGNCPAPRGLQVISLPPRGTGPAPAGSPVMINNLAAAADYVIGC